MSIVRWWYGGMMANEIPGFADHHPSIHPFPYQHPSHPMRNQHQSHDDARGVRRCLSRHNICSSLFPFDCSCPQRLQCPTSRRQGSRQRCGRVGGRWDGGWPPWGRVSVLLLFNSCLQRLQRPSPPQEGWHCRRIDRQDQNYTFKIFLDALDTLF